uniref:Uncharacterized protein n=1 Tax=Arion vulgaris TaxID=1028688 RepID=A0A0B6YFW1_9EUPU
MFITVTRNEQLIAFLFILILLFDEGQFITQYIWWLSGENDDWKHPQKQPNNVTRYVLN